MKADFVDTLPLLLYLLSRNCIKKKSNYIKVFMPVCHNLVKRNIRLSSQIHFERSDDKTQKNLKLT
jgi:hypothetical protein